MNLEAIREECWSIARDDTALVDEDRLWKQDEMNRIINRVYYDIARRTKCISDATTPAVCLIDLTPVDYTTYTNGTFDYIWANDPNSSLYHLNVTPYILDLNPAILEILEAKLVNLQWRLIKVSSSKWKENTYWEQIVSSPTEYALDLESGKIALNARSTTSDSIKLHVKRLPLNKLSSNTDTPELKEEYHDLMLNGILYHMYSKQDAETIDEVKANDYRAKYEMDIDEIKHRESFYGSHLSPNNPIGAFL